VIPWKAFELHPAEIKLKRAAMEKHESQFVYCGTYMLLFARRTELFGDFQPIRFTDRPLPSAVETDQPKNAATPEAEPFLEDQERTLFVGIERRTLDVAGGQLKIGISFSRPFADTTSLSIYAFGYRHDKPFEKMPKIHVEVGLLRHRLLDQSNVLPPELCPVNRTANEFVVSIPLKVLGDPERILTSARTYTADIPLDWASWRMVELGSYGGAAAGE
jgi:hypothetical protein